MVTNIMYCNTINIQFEAYRNVFNDIWPNSF